jgi:hypothetical protein
MCRQVGDCVGSGRAWTITEIALSKAVVISEPHFIPCYDAVLVSSILYGRAYS